jgi:hypothetical protein
MTATTGTVGTVAQCPGLVSWVSTVRTQLASAAGAAEFAEFVQVKGFDWLASYVEGVLNDEYVSTVLLHYYLFDADVPAVI